MMLNKGNATRKLSLEKVQQIRQLYGEGYTQGALSRHFGVSIGQVGRIVRGESWQDTAGNRLPTQAEADKTLENLLALQQQVRVAPELLSSPPARIAPPSLLDGGDAPDETGGAGIAATLEKASALGVDIDRLMKEGAKK
jgi:hypothetical protein